MRVLVVDDEPAVRQALERALRFEGFTAELAEDGMAGLAAHAERPADAIVLDIAMPRLDGLEMCRRLAPPVTGRRCSCSPPSRRSQSEWTASTRVLTTTW